MPASKSKRKFTSVSIPVTLFNKISKRIKNTGFTSVSSYVTFVLRQIFAEEERKQQARSPFSPEDEQRVKARLRALGYL